MNQATIDVIFKNWSLLIGILFAIRSMLGSLILGAGG